MPEVAAAVEAGPTGAAFLQGALVAGVAGVAQSNRACKRVDELVPTAARG